MVSIDVIGLLIVASYKVHSYIITSVPPLQLALELHVYVTLKPNNGRSTDIHCKCAELLTHSTVSCISGCVQQLAPTQIKHIAGSFISSHISFPYANIHHNLLHQNFCSYFAIIPIYNQLAICITLNHYIQYLEQLFHPIAHTSKQQQRENHMFLLITIISYIQHQSQKMSHSSKCLDSKQHFHACS